MFSRALQQGACGSQDCPSRRGQQSQLVNDKLAGVTEPGGLCRHPQTIQRWRVEPSVFPPPPPPPPPEIRDPVVVVRYRAAAPRSGGRSRPSSALSSGSSSSPPASITTVVGRPPAREFRRQPDPPRVGGHPLDASDPVVVGEPRSPPSAARAGRGRSGRLTSPPAPGWSIERGVGARRGRGDETRRTTAGFKTRLIRWTPPSPTDGGLTGCHQSGTVRRGRREHPHRGGGSDRRAGPRGSRRAAAGGGTRPLNLVGRSRAVLVGE